MNDKKSEPPLKKPPGAPDRIPVKDPNQDKKKPKKDPVPPEKEEPRQ